MSNETVDQADEEDLLGYEVSDEALEAAAGNEAMTHSNVYLLGLLLPEVSSRPTLPHSPPTSPSFRSFCSDDSDRSAVRGQPLGFVHQRAGILGRRRRLGLIAARSIGEAVVGDMSVHSVVPVQGIGGA